MSIKNLTDSKTLSLVKRGVPIVGDFRKGEEKDEKGRWGKDLEDGSWRVTFREGYEMFEEMFHACFNDTREPFIIATIDETPDDVFNDFYRLYGGNGMAQIVCDGENIEFAANGQVSKCRDCPLKHESATKAEKGKLCKPNAYFRFTIPKFNAALQMPVPFLFQFNVKARTELQHIKKELNVAYEAKGSLVNELFLLYRNNRKFNRSGSGNEKSLAYVLWLDKNLNEKAKEAQLQLNSGDYQEQPQLPAGNANGQLTDNPPPNNVPENNASNQMGLDEYKSCVQDVANKWLGMDMSGFLFQFGTFSTIEDMQKAHPDWQKARQEILNWVVNNNIQVRIYACKTFDTGSTQAMEIPFGLSKVIAGSRKQFSGSQELQEKAHSAYTGSDGSVKNLTQTGWHKFKEVFGVDFLSMEVEFNGNGNLKIKTITDDIPF